MIKQTCASNRQISHVNATESYLHFGRFVGDDSFAVLFLILT